MHAAPVMLFTCEDDIAVRWGCFLSPNSPPYTNHPVLCICGAVEKWLVFVFPRIKLNAIKLNVMMRTCKSLGYQQINENSYRGLFTDRVM
jgi:hypothetical protein